LGLFSDAGPCSRLKEAAFDPANKDSRNIMAGTAGPVPMIPAMTDDER
jgi:hypothetical protein